MTNTRTCLSPVKLWERLTTSSTTSSFTSKNLRSHSWESMMWTRHLAFYTLQMEFTGQTAPSGVCSVSRVEMVNVTGQYQYQKANSFVREPFAVLFESHKTGEASTKSCLSHSSHQDISILTVCCVVSSTFCHVAIKKFVLVALHTEPQQTVQELDRLYDVFEEVFKKWKNAVRFQGTSWRYQPIFSHKRCRCRRCVM